MPEVELTDVEPARRQADVSRTMSSDSGRQGPRGPRALYMLVGMVVGAVILVALVALVMGRSDPTAGTPAGATTGRAAGVSEGVTAEGGQARDAAGAAVSQSTREGR